jgi:heptosyltransferase II
MEFRNVPHLNRLVIAAPNWLGDAVMALPAIADVRRTWPDAHLAVAARGSIAPLFTLVPGVNQVVDLPPAGAPASAAAEALRGHAFDAALLLPNSFHIAMAAKRAGIRERWGYRADWRGRLLTRGISRREGMHQAEYYQRLVHELGCANGPMRPELSVPESARRSGIDLVRTAGWAERAPLVALAPGAAFGGAKRWPAQSFASVAAELSKHGAAIVMIGAPADRLAGSEVEAALESLVGRGMNVINLVGKTDLPTLAGVLLAARVLVTNDSGAMHLAAALGVAVTAMFGPTRERETRPLAAAGGPDPVVLTHDVWCRPCMLRECPLLHACMRGIAADAVVAALRRTL